MSFNLEKFKMGVAAITDSGFRVKCYRVVGERLDCIFNNKEYFEYGLDGKLRAEDDETMDLVEMDENSYVVQVLKKTPEGIDNLCEEHVFETEWQARAWMSAVNNGMWEYDLDKVRLTLHTAYLGD